MTNVSGSNWINKLNIMRHWLNKNCEQCHAIVEVRLYLDNSYHEDWHKPIRIINRRERGNKMNVALKILLLLLRVCCLLAGGLLLPSFYGFLSVWLSLLPHFSPSAFLLSLSLFLPPQPKWPLLLWDLISVFSNCKASWDQRSKSKEGLIEGERKRPPLC